MAKVFECGAVVPGCNFVTHGESESDLVMKAVEHLRSSHEVEHPSERFKDKIRAVIKDD